MNVREAGIDDLSRVAEIYVFNNRINYFPIFRDEMFSFGELQVVSLTLKKCIHIQFTNLRFIHLNKTLYQSIIKHIYVF